MLKRNLLVVRLKLDYSTFRLLHRGLITQLFGLYADDSSLNPWACTQRKAGEASAYTVFNNFEYLEGELRMEQVPPSHAADGRVMGHTVLESCAPLPNIAHAPGHEYIDRNLLKAHLPQPRSLYQDWVGRFENRSKHSETRHASFTAHPGIDGNPHLLLY